MEHYKMNMIGTGQFDVKADASQELVKKLVGTWDKKSLQAARAGGVSTLALALAACGGEDNTPFAQADLDAAIAPLNTQIATLTTAKAAADDAVEAAEADLETAQSSLTTVQADLTTSKADLATATANLTTANATVERLNSEASDAADALAAAIAERDTATASLTTANSSLATANADLTAANTSLAEVRTDLGLSSTATAQDMMSAITALEDSASANGDVATAAKTSLSSLRTDLGLADDASTQEMIDAITALETAASDAATARDAATGSLAAIAVDLGIASGASEAEIIAAIDDLQAAVAAANPTAVTSYTVSASDLVSANANSSGILALSMTGSPDDASVAVASAGIDYKNLIITAGDTNVTVTAGNQSGSDGDTITIVGDGNNTVNVGEGADTVVFYGSGNNTVIFASGNLTAADAVTGGTGTNDTVQLSGDGNVISGNLTGVENITLAGTTLTIDAADLIALSGVSGSISTSEITVDMNGATALDLSEVSLTGIEKLTANTQANITLSEAQINQIGAIETTAGALTITTSVAGLTALGSKATSASGTVTLAVVDTNENILAGADAISAAGASATLTGSVTVAQAEASLEAGSGAGYELSDTAANLALADTAVFANATTVVVSTTATAAEATAINAAMPAVAGLADNKVTINVADTATNMANYYTEATSRDANSATATDAMNVAEATALHTENTGATFAVTDTAANLKTAATTTDSGAVVGSAVLAAATSVTVSGSVSYDQYTKITANGTSADLTLSGYAAEAAYATLTDDYANNAGNLTVSDALSVAKAIVVNSYSNSGTTSFTLSDTAAALTAASSAVVGNASSAVTTDTAHTVAVATALYNKYGATVLKDATFVIEDTAANLVAMSAAVGAEASKINVDGHATLSEAATLTAAYGSSGSVSTALAAATLSIADKASALVAGSADTDDLALMNAAVTNAKLNVTETISLEDAVTINSALTNPIDGVFTLADTGAVITAGAGNTPAGAQAVVASAAAIEVSDSVSVANTVAIQAVAGGGSGLTLGTTFTYVLADEAGNVGSSTQANADAAKDASSITVTTAATGEQATIIAALSQEPAYSIVDVYDEILGGSNGQADSVLDGATSVTVQDTVSNLQADSGAALTAIAADASVDAIIVKDDLTNLSATGDAVVAATSVTIKDAALDASSAADVNAIAAVKPTTYAVVAVASDLNDALAATGSGKANETGAVTTYLNGATTITFSAAASVADFNTLDAGTTSTINAVIEGATLAELAGSTATAAVKAAVASGGAVSVATNGSLDGTVNQLNTLTDLGLDISKASGLKANAVDTASNLNTKTGDWIAALDSVTVTDNGTVNTDVAGATKLFGTDGSFYGNYTLTDTGANIVTASEANSNGGVGLINGASKVTLIGDDVSIANGNKIAALTSLEGAIAYNVTGTATALADSGAAATTAIANAANITATGTAATIAEAKVLDAATNSGTTSYSIGDAYAKFINSTPETQALITSAVENATGTVVVSDDATVAAAEVIAAMDATITFDVTGSAADIVAASAAVRNDAANMVVTGTDASATSVANANSLMAATNSGTTTIAEVAGTAAQVLTLTIGSNDVLTDITVTGTTSAADAASIVALDTGTNITKTIEFAAITGTATEIAALGDTVLAAATKVTVTPTLTVSEYATLDAAITIANVDSLSITDSFANIAENSTAANDLDYKTAFEHARVDSVTVQDTALTVTQADVIDGLSNVVYSVKDDDESLTGALSGAVLSGAANVTSSDGTALDIVTIGDTPAKFIAGTKAEIDAMDAHLTGSTGAKLAYEVTVADLAANPDFYANLGSGHTITVTDSSANLLSGNALLANATHIVVTDVVSVADATSIRALSTLDTTVYSVSDTAANLADTNNAAALNGAVNVTQTGTAATFAQADTIADLTNSGTTSYAISDADAKIADALDGGSAANDGVAGASSITVTGSTGITSAQATLLLDANANPVTLALVTGNSDKLATMATSVGTGQTVTAVTPSNASKDVEIAPILGYSTPTAYSLTGTAAEITALSSSVLNGAADITVTGPATVTVAQATIIDNASNSGSNSYSISDTADTVLAASASLLATSSGSGNMVFVTDTNVSASQATSLRSLDAANNDNSSTSSTTEGFVVHASGNTSTAGVFAISDTHANLISSDNAAAVAASTAVTATGTLSTAQAVSLETAASGDSKPTYSLSGTYAEIVINQTGAKAVDLTSVKLTVSDAVNVAQAKLIYGYSNSVTQNISDTPANVAGSASHAAVTSATSTITLSAAGSVSDLATIEGLYSGSYSVSDTAAKISTALNTANAAKTADNALVNGAASVTASTLATIAEAAGASTSMGLYTVSGISYGITEADPGKVYTALQGNDSAAITGASTIQISGTTSMTVQEATAVTALSNFVGYDADRTDNTDTEFYYIDDTASALQAASPSLLTGAESVDASGTDDADTMNLSMHSADITFTGGKKDDTMTGGSGADDFVFIAAANNGADVINGFVSTSDQLDLQALSLDQGATKQEDILTALSTAKIKTASAEYAAGAALEDALGVIAITDEAAEAWGDVDAKIEGALTVDGTASNNATLVLLIDNGTDTRIYNYTDATNGFDAGDDLTLIGTVSGVEVDGFVAADFII